MPMPTWDADFIKANAILAPSFMSVQNMVANAIAEERERCARIAEDAINNMNGQRKAGMARAIARRIRKP